MYVLFSGKKIWTAQPKRLLASALQYIYSLKKVKILAFLGQNVWLLWRKNDHTCVVTTYKEMRRIGQEMIQFWFFFDFNFIRDFRNFNIFEYFFLKVSRLHVGNQQSYTLPSNDGPWLRNFENSKFSIILMNLSRLVLQIDEFRSLARFQCFAAARFSFTWLVERLHRIVIAQAVSIVRQFEAPGLVKICHESWNCPAPWWNIEMRFDRFRKRNYVETWRKQDSGCMITISRTWKSQMLN